MRAKIRTDLKKTMETVTRGLPKRISAEEDDSGEREEQSVCSRLPSEKLHVVSAILKQSIVFNETPLTLL